MAKTLEYYFNPKTAQKNGIYFETACFIPKTRKEKQKGILYCIAESSSNSYALKEIQQNIQKEFYQNNFQSALNKANELFNLEPNKNLNLAILSLSYPFKIKVSLVGKIKILLLRGEEAFDISAGLEKQGLLKFIEGNLQKNDKLIFLTNDIFNVFLKYKILNKIAKKNQKEIKLFFKENKTFFRSLRGALMIAFIKKAPWPLCMKKPKNPLPPPSKIEKGVIATILLIILLLLGYLIF